MKLTIPAMAALLVAALAACSGEDDQLVAFEGSPLEKEYTLSVETAKGIGAVVGDLQSQTRALTQSGSTLTASWATTDRVYVQKGGTWATGSLQPQTAGATATLKGSLTGVAIAADDVLTLQFPKSGTPDYSGQKGTLEDIAANYDYATATATVRAVSANGMVAADATTFTNQQAIVRFTLLDAADGTTPVNATSLTVSDGTNTYSVNPAAATNDLYVAMPGFSGQTVSLNATSLSGVFDFEKEGITFTNGQYYTVTVKMPKTKNVYTDPAAWNAASETNPVLVLNADITTDPFVVTRADGVIDFNGYSAKGNIYMQNDVAGSTVTLRNGTAEKEIDGAGGWKDGYLGTVVLEDMTVNRNVYVDGHTYIFKSGTYKAGVTSRKPDNTPAGPVIVYGGNFKSFFVDNPRAYGPYTVYGGKFQFDPRTVTFTSVTIPSGYSVKANPDDDAATYPWIVTAD